jgi:hypothetical protein
MTVESIISKKIYHGNGQARVFPVPFAYNRTDDLRLLHTDAEGKETPITSNYHVNVNQAGDTSVTYPVSGDPLTPGSKLTVLRHTPRTQIVDLNPGGSFEPKVLEKDGFDRAAMQIQELQEEVSRAIKISISSEEAPKTAEQFYDEVNEIADRAGEAATRSEDARDRAEDAAQTAVARADELQTLSVAAVDIPYGLWSAATYNPETGMLTVYVPQGRPGEQGEQGIQGTQGLPGMQGIQGVQGIQGFQGEQGNTGVQGRRGERGFRGKQGIQGIPGPPGSPPYAGSIDGGGAYETMLDTIDGGTANAFI